MQYGDYAEWESEHLDSGALEPQRAYWARQLAGAPRQLGLPYDRPPSASLETEWVTISLSPELSDGLRRFSRARGVTPFATLLAAFTTLLHRCAEQRDIVVGTILSRRTRSETEPLIGNFGNNLLLRTTLDGDPTLGDVVDRTAATLGDALANSDVPLELVARDTPIPAFHVMFILRDGRFEERLALPGARVEGIDAASGAATLDLILDVTDGSRGIEGHLEYRTARFAAATMERFARALEGVITTLVRESGTRLSELPRFRPAPPPEPESAVAPMSGGEAPVTATEHHLAKLWREWLEVADVHRGDNFFRLGGDSLRAVYVLERIERELGRRLHPEELSRATLAELAALCDGTAVAIHDASRTAPPLQVQRVDPMRHGDEIKQLFAREGFPGHVAFFDRAYPGAVASGATSWIARDARGEIVGHMAVIPHAFVCGSARYTGALGANLVMDGRHRNLTSAMALVETVMRDLEREPDVDFVFGDPNEDARAILGSIGGFTDVGTLGRFVLPLGEAGIVDAAIGAYLSLAMRNGRGESLTMSRCDAREFDAGEIERPAGDAPLLRPVHPVQLYGWRLEGYPTERDAWYVFERGSERVAAMLVRRLTADGLAHLGSVWRHPGIPLVSLLGPVAAELRRQGLRRLQAYTLVPSPLERELRNAGFRLRERAAPFIARACSPRGRELLERGVEWEITDLDCDRGLDQ